MHTVTTALQTRRRESPLRRGAACLFKLLTLCVAAIVLSGCSMTRIAYNQLDWLTVWALDDYFDLSKEQEAELRAMVDRNLEWHRYTQLPRYAEFLREFDVETQGPVTPDMLRARYDQMLVFWDDFMLQIIPDTQTFLMGLTPEQIDTMFEEAEESNEELYDDYSGDTAEKRRQRRDKASIRGIQMLTGKLNKDQKEFIKASTANMVDASEDWIDNRRVWQEKFRALLEQRPPPEEYRAQLTELFLTPRDLHDPDYRSRVETNLQLFFEMMSDLFAQLEDRQKERMSRRLNWLASDFDMLALDK